MSPSALTQLLDRLTARGMLSRSYSDIDRRLVLAGITNKGQDLITAFLPTAP